MKSPRWADNLPRPPMNGSRHAGRWRNKISRMKARLMSVGALAGIALLAGCYTVPPGAERGPNGTVAYNVVIEASDPGATIKANGEDLGHTPVTLKIYGDPDGTF